MKIKKLNILQAEYIAHRYAIERMNFENEPMPAFDSRTPGKLESCLAEPFMTFDGKPLHYSFYQRAALLFYLVVKNHCFSNGNKRMAVTLTSVFFYINKRWLDIDTKTLYNIANEVAASKAYEKDKVVLALSKAFKEYSSRLV